MPLAGAGLLLWVAYKGAIGLVVDREARSSAGIAVLGVIMLVVAVKVYKSPIFKIKTEAATTTEATPHVGAG